MPIRNNHSALLIIEEGTPSARPLLRGKLPAWGLRELGWRAKAAPVLYEEGEEISSGNLVSFGTFNGWSPGETKPTPTPKFIVSRPLLQPEKDSKPELNEYLQLDNMKFVSHSQIDIIQTAQEHGQYFLLDLDDDIWNVPKWNPAIEKIDEYRENWLNDLAVSNGLVVSTWHIKYQAEQHGVKVPIYLCPNSCNWWDFPVIPYENDILRVAWFGVLSSRQQDIEPYVEEIKWALEGRRDTVEFWHIGATLNGRDTIRDILRPFPVDIIERPWTDDIQDVISEIDIGIIPAMDIPFNYGRSNALGLQFAAAGKPFIATRLHEYQLLNDAGVSCATDSFAEPLAELIEDVEYREWFRETAPAIIRAKFSPEVIAKEYVKAFEDAARTDNKER